jgi:hypothetical protein
VIDEPKFVPGVSDVIGAAMWQVLKPIYEAREEELGMRLSVGRETPDGLDPVFDAYNQLKRIYAAATPAIDVCKCGGKDERCPCDSYILLPGTNESVMYTDLNELSALEYWLAEEVARRSVGGD